MRRKPALDFHQSVGYNFAETVVFSNARTICGTWKVIMMKAIIGRLQLKFSLCAAL